MDGLENLFEILELNLVRSNRFNAVNGNNRLLIDDEGQAGECRRLAEEYVFFDNFIILFF